MPLISHRIPPLLLLMKKVLVITSAAAVTIYCFGHCPRVHAEGGRILSTNEQIQLVIDAYFCLHIEGKYTQDESIGRSWELLLKQGFVKEQIMNALNDPSYTLIAPRNCGSLVREIRGESSGF